MKQGIRIFGLAFLCLCYRHQAGAQVMAALNKASTDSIEHYRYSLVREAFQNNRFTGGHLLYLNFFYDFNLYAMESNQSRVYRPKVSRRLIETYLEGLDEISTEIAGEYYDRGQARIDSGKFVEAMTDFDHSLTYTPKYSDAYVGRASLFIYSAQYPEALEELSKAQRFNPKNPEVPFNRGIILFAQQKLPQSLIEIDSSLKLQPEYGRAWFEKGLILEAMGQPEEAIKALRKARYFNDPDAAKVIRDIKRRIKQGPAQSPAAKRG